MLPGPLVFVDIDTQRDFLEPGGALFIPGGPAIIPNLARLNQFAIDNQVPVLATACAHSPDDPELKQFPAHCMAGTSGQERVAATARQDSTVLSVSERLVGSIPSHLTLLKHELDLFSRPDADGLIARYNQAKPTFVVYGVATDCCVNTAVNGLLKRGCRVAIVTDAVRAIDQSAEAAILKDFALGGALLTVTAVVCGVPAP
jgi:nicotinamidase/pyrazinamidase